MAACGVLRRDPLWAKWAYGRGFYCGFHNALGLIRTCMAGVVVARGRNELPTDFFVIEITYAIPSLGTCLLTRPKPFFRG
jgi:hypothetical protein